MCKKTATLKYYYSIVAILQEIFKISKIANWFHKWNSLIYLDK